MNKSFLLLLVSVAILGAALGGAFVGGVVYGRSQAANANMLPPGFDDGFAGGGPSVGVPAGAVAGPGGVGFVAPPGVEGGFPGAGPGNGGTLGLGGGRGGLTGTVAEVDGNNLSLTTPQGNTLVTLTADTTLSRLSSADRAELTAGVTVRLTGRPNADSGIFQARSLVIIPEGTANPFEGGGNSGSSRRGGRGEGGQ